MWTGWSKPREYPYCLEACALIPPPFHKLTRSCIIQIHPKQPSNVVASPNQENRAWFEPHFLFIHLFIFNSSFFLLLPLRRWTKIHSYFDIHFLFIHLFIFNSSFFLLLPLRLWTKIHSYFDIHFLFIHLFIFNSSFFLLLPLRLWTKNPFLFWQGGRSRMRKSSLSAALLLPFNKLCLICVAWDCSYETIYHWVTN